MHSSDSIAVDAPANTCDDLTKPFAASDVTVLVEEKRLYFNCAFLSMHSPYFRRMLSGGENTDSGKEIKLLDKHFDDIHVLLKLLLNFANDSGLITDANVGQLLELAKEFELANVTAWCESFLIAKWKFDEAKIVGAISLAAKYGLHSAIKDLLKRPGEKYPVLLTDENLEEILAVAKQYDVAYLSGTCERYLLENWKKRSDKIVRAVELSAKYGLEKAVANLLKNEKFERCNITDENVEQLLELCRQHLLPEIQSDCLQFIMESWITKSDKALQAIELAHQMNMPDLAQKFIPLAACRALEEIDAALPKLSTELYAAIVHAAFLRIRHAMDGASKRAFTLAYPICAHGYDGYHHTRCHAGCYLGSSTDTLTVLSNNHTCGKSILGSTVDTSPGAEQPVGLQACTCIDTAPASDHVTDEMLKRGQKM